MSVVAKRLECWMNEDATWYTEVGLGPGDIVLDRDPASPPKNGQNPQFLAHVYCGQTAGWIKMPLGMEVVLGPGHIVPDGDRPSFPSRKRGTASPIFGLFLLWPNGWMHQDATWYGGRPQPRRRCVGWGPSTALKGAQPPSFRLMSIVTKRLDG